MKIPLTPQLLGDLIEKGYTYMLSSSKQLSDAAEQSNIVLKPLREKPKLNNLPQGYETFYRITREPMQLACGVEGVTIDVDYITNNSLISADDVFEDSYFRMSEEYFKQVLESIEDYAIFTTDKNGDVNSWNSGAENILGYTEPEAIGLNSAIFFTAEDRAKAAPENELRTAIEKGRAIDERYHVRKDNSRFWGTGLVFPLFDEDEKHRGFTKIMRNMREEEDAKSHGSPG